MNTILGKTQEGQKLLERIHLSNIHCATGSYLI